MANSRNYIKPSRIGFIGLWLLFCSWAVVTGWILSIFRSLNIAGYCLSALIAACLLFVFRNTYLPERPKIRLHKIKRRFSSLYPLLYLIVFCMALLGGALYAPSNYDALSHRFARVLHWSAEGGWQWIHTVHYALNTRTAVTEWITAPLFLFTASDRLLFLPNIISFAFLPGLVFRILTQLGISTRVSWQWMWIFPSAYCFAIQAGSIGNDLIGATLFLAAISYALKARKSLRWSDFLLACLGMALASGAKFSNIPLGIVWIIIILPASRLLLCAPLRCLALAPILILTSFLPTAWLNHKYCGDWTGMAVEPTKLTGGDPLLFVSWNIPYLLIQNTVPPIFPFSQQWNHAVTSRIPPDLNRKLEANFQADAAKWITHEIMIEENAPLGLGIVSLLIVGSIGAFQLRHRAPRSFFPREQKLLWLVFAGAIIAISPIILKSGLNGSGRYLAPHYLLLILPFLTFPGLKVFMRGKLWKTSVLICFLALFLTMILSPARPLWPALTVLKSLNAGNSSSSILNRAWSVYTVYRERPTAFEPIMRHVPEDAICVGLLSANTPETSFWKPFGKRRIVHITASDTPESIRNRGIEYIVAGQRSMEENNFPDIKVWCELNHADIIATEFFPVMVRKGSEPWFLLKLSELPDKS